MSYHSRQRNGDRRDHRPQEPGERYDNYRRYDDYDRGRNYNHQPPPPGYGHVQDRAARSGNEDAYYDNHSHPYDYYRPKSRSPPPPRMSEAYGYESERQYEPRNAYERNDYRRGDAPRFDPPTGPREDMYRFGANDRREAPIGYNNQGEFSFRSERQADFRGNDQSYGGGRRAGRQGGNDRRQNQGRRSQPWQRRGPPPANERSILHANVEREATPERLQGMLEGASRFKGLDSLDETSDVEQTSEYDNSAEAPAKKRAKTDAHEAKVDETPKWSNPDPYFSCPPIDESRGKRRDVVQLIRKAKIEPDAAAAEIKNAVTKNSDYIGFGDEEDADDDALECHVSVGDGKDMHLKITGNGHTAANLTSSTTSNVHPGQAEATNRAPPTGPAASLKSKFPTKSRAPQRASNPLAEAGERSPSRPPPKKKFERPNELEDNLDTAGIIASNTTRENGKPKKRKAEEGDISTSWAAKDRRSSSPWFTDHSNESTFYTPRQLLHREINDFYAYIKPTPHEARVRLGVIDRVQKIASRVMTGSKVTAFGSYSQGVYLPTADLDLVLLSRNYQAEGRSFIPQKNTLYKLKSAILRADFCYNEDIQVVARAKVPIIKFIDDLTGIKCDMSVDNDSGLHAIAAVDAWKLKWPFIPEVLSILKQFLMMRDLNEVFNGGLGGFSLTCMLVSVLQKSPLFCDAEPRDINLGDVLLEFFDLYGNKFDMDENAISVNPSRYYPKTGSSGIVDLMDRPYKPQRWTIFDPNRADNDMSGGTTQAPLIKRKFAEAHELLTNLMDILHTGNMTLRKDASFLRLIIGGNYDDMILQRNILRDVHLKYHGPIQTPTYEWADNNDV